MNLIMENPDGSTTTKPYIAPLIAGAVAGISVDLIFYPLDTLKTRLQSEKGFYKAGGFRGVYRGLAPVAATSMPTSALFFVWYETSKNIIQPLVAPQYAPLVHMLAASSGGIMTCLIQVPVEIAKQRKQTYVGAKKLSAVKILMDAYKADGIRNGLYRGFFSTMARDIPFSLIDLPVWEMLKTMVKERNGGEITGFQSACCGSVASGFTAVATTPLDLAKTRIMLAEDYAETRKLRIRPVLASIYLESGFRGLFAGAFPRMVAFTLGGFVFFGAYDSSRILVEKYQFR